MKGFSKSIVRVLIVSFFALLAIELCCFLFFTAFENRFTFYSPGHLLLSPAKFERAARIFDAELGWRRHFDTPFEERPRLKSYGRPMLATFGDSYTYGEQVADGQTYQHYLARRLQADVLNFGQGGHGTDQALLRFRSVYPRVKTPLVSMGLITENINRIVNVFSPYYNEKTALALAKPRFVLRDGQLVLIPSPVRSTAEIPKLADARFVQSLGVHDWWYNRDHHPVLKFPYTTILFNRRLWLDARQSAEVDDITPRPWENLWGDEEARTLMFAILDSFMEEAARQGGIPLIILSPRKGEVLEKVRGQEPKDAAVLLDFCRKRAYRCFDGIAALTARAGAPEQVPTYYNGHLNPRGNQVFAAELHRWLIAQKLVAEPPRRGRHEAPRSAQ